MTDIAAIREAHEQIKAGIADHQQADKFLSLSFHRAARILSYVIADAEAEAVGKRAMSNIGRGAQSVMTLREFAFLLSLLDVMKSARSKDGLMRVWDRDIVAVEKAIAALKTVSEADAKVTT